MVHDWSLTIQLPCEGSPGYKNEPKAGMEALDSKIFLGLCIRTYIADQADVWSRLQHI